MSSTAQSLPSSMKAIQIQAQGGPEVIELRDVPVPKPGPGQVLIRVEHAGVNFIDTYKRAGLYKVPLPHVLGHEPAGAIVSVGEGVQDYSVGDRVAAYIGEGAFAEYTLAAERQLAKLPDSVSTKDGATVLLQGLTCLTMIRDAHLVKKGEYVLVHAAAGGTGLLLCQMLKHAGAHVIGTVSTPEKAELAKQAGAEHVFLYAKETLSDVIQKIKAVTPGGEGVHAVLDGVGKDTFESGFEVARRKATLVTFGNASGAVEPFAPLKLAAKNLKVIRPVLNNYVVTKEEMQTYSKELFELYGQGAFRLSTWKDGYPFTADGIRQAQDDLTSRRTTGKLVVNIA